MSAGALGCRRARSPYRTRAERAAVIAVCGEAIVDLVSGDPNGDGARFTARSGGSPANTAVGIARLGTPVQLLARLSRSSLGALIRRHLEANGVLLGQVVDAPEPQSLAVVARDAGEASYAFHLEGAADWQWRARELAGAPDPDARVLHCGSLAALVAPGRDAILGLMERVRLRALVSYDPNLRASVVPGGFRTRRRVERLVAASHLVKASTADLALAYPGVAPESVARHFLELGARLVVVTDGPAGATAYDRRGTLSSPGFPVEVVDTIGAGDAFSAALLEGIYASRFEGALVAGELEHASLGALLTRACAAAALACTRLGADPPRSEELEAFLGARR